MKAESSPLDQIMERILELSADAQIARRLAARNSLEFHSLSGAISAYSKVIELVMAAKERQELLAAIERLEFSDAWATTAN